ncbi:MAG: phosphoenolpyruvate--protein phosphotransferase, partial [Planctomycetes bacterium]|nr:phosphoenolpyruvate--protein phosphotransferase [Planctomycetota bacterium]
MVHEISAIAASPGIAIAPLRHLRLAGEFVPRYRIEDDELDAECERFRVACTKAAEALERLKEKLGEAAGSVLGIYDAHIALVTDPRLQSDVEAGIRKDKINAEAALQAVVAGYEQIFRRIDSVTVRERAADVRDVGRQITGMLLQRAQGSDGDDGLDFILAVDEFLPSDLGKVDTKHVRGIVMGEGGRYSHGAILAKSLGIPCVVGLEHELAKLPAGRIVILDAERGRLLVDPDRETIERYEERIEESTAAERRIFEVRLSQSVTIDGTPVTLLANIEGTRELDALEPGMFKGVGLFRTEFAFMERLMFPSEEEQFELYSKIVESMGGRNVTFRTLDIGGDKPLQYFRTPVERNPVLGWRGIRLTLQWRDIFYTQMRALIRASSKGPVSILLPMVTTLGEVRQAREILDEIVG